MTVNRSSVTGFTLSRGKILCTIAISCVLASCAEDGSVTVAFGLQTPSPALVRGAALTPAAAVISVMAEDPML